MNDDVSYGVLLPTREAVLDDATWRIDELVDVAVEAERLGFASVWAGDALNRRLDTLTTLAAVASVTERVLLGTAALLPVVREPIVTGQVIATLDQLSRGRVVLGLGAGFPGMIQADLARTGGSAYRTRYSRLDDIVALWRRLWSGSGPATGSDPDDGDASFHGRTLHIDSLPDMVRSYHPGGPPIWFAGDTPAGLERTGRQYDGWIPYPPDPADYARGLARIREVAADAGRDPSAITPSLYVTVLVTDAADGGRAELTDYCQAFYGLPLEYVETIQLLVAGSPEQVAEQLGRFVDAGARHLVVRIGALDRRDHLPRIAEALPGFRVPAGQSG
jgi:alkanesulfonate monooxygenase SsuD/methylene tetrahydromethanopterin reductase-like flavin-dependent oxidoreductase (luciferase family)